LVTIWRRVVSLFTTASAGEIVSGFTGEGNGSGLMGEASLILINGVGVWTGGANFFRRIIEVVFNVDAEPKFDVCLGVGVPVGGAPNALNRIIGVAGGLAEVFISDPTPSVLTEISDDIKDCADSPGG
jgi:hypothetical protein